MKKRILSFLLALTFIISSMPLTAIPAGAEDLSGVCGAEGDNLTWTYNEKLMTLTVSGTGDMINYAGGDTPWYDVIHNVQSIVIEDGVTSIGDYAFSEAYSVTSVTIPDGVMKIGADAFSDCFFLPEITVPETVVYIDSSAFRNCHSLSEFYIPASVTTLGNSVFFGCGGLKRIDVAEDNLYFSDVDGVLFDKNVSKIIQYPASKAGGFYKIPDGVTEIGAFAFPMGRNLIGLELPDSITTIGDDAFNSSYSVFYIIIPETVTSIGVGAFSECYSLCHVLYKGSESAYEKIHFGLENDSLNKAVVHFDATGDEIEKQTVKETSCTASGVCSYFCTLCEEALYEEHIERLPHSFKDGVCESCGTLEADLIESEHPYPDNCDETKTIYKEGAKWIKVSFSENTYTEMCDYIYIYDGEDNEIGSYSDSQLAGKSIGITGDTVKIRLTSDSSVTFYGYEVIAVKYSYEECTHPTTQVVGVRQPHCTMEGYTGDTVCAECFAVMTPGEVIAPTGHSFEGDVCTKCGMSIFSYGYLSDENGNFYGIEVMNYNGADTDVVVPSEIDGYPVVRIGTWAFSSRSHVTSVTLPDSITGIGSAAFDGCTSLKSINLPEGLTDLGDQAFNCCSSLESIVIPDGITTIGDWMFQSCTSLRSVTLPDSVTSLGTQAFNNCKSLESINIPEGITSIGAWQFGHCDSLKHLELPESVKSIDEGAFYGCDSLLNVTFKGVETIGREAFAWCISLASITVSEDLKTVSDAAFSSCSAFNHIYYAGSESQWNDVAISETLNNNIKNATVHFETTEEKMRSYSFESSCTVAGEEGVLCTVCNEKVYAELLPELSHTFADGVCEVCGNFEADLIESDHPYSDNCDETKVIYKEGAKRMKVTFSSESKTEDGCDHVYIYDVNDNMIGSFSGNELSGKTVAVTGDTVKVRLTSDGSSTHYGYAVVSVMAYYEDCAHTETSVVGSRAPGCDYYGYTGDTVCNECMQTVEQGESIEPTGHSYSGDTCTKCGAYVYSYYHINNDVGETVGVGIGRYNGTETEINIPSAIDGYPVLEIGSNAFDDKGFITKITLPETLTRIEGQAFYGCYSLESINIPDGVNYIGRSAFCVCSSLKSIRIPSGVTYIDEWTFGNCEALESVELCGAITSVGAYSFYSCRKLESITFNEGLVSIGELAFGGCETLKEVSLPEGLVSIGNTAFTGCIKLESIDLPNSLETIGNYAFNGCSRLTEVNISEKLTVVSEGAFWGCGFTSLVIPEGVETIGSHAFANCSELRYLVLPESVTSIGYGVFGSAYNLRHVFYGGSEEKLGEISVADYNEWFVNAVKHWDVDGANVTVSVTEPTCAKSGRKTVSCGICNEEIYTERLPALAHSFTDGVCDRCQNLEADLVESEHPYHDNTDETKTIYKEGAKWIKIVFAEDSYLQGDDTVYVYDGADNELYSYRNDLGGSEAVIFSDTVKIRLVTDSAVTDFGYAVCSVTAYYEDCTHPETEWKWGYEPTCESSGHTGEEWCIECLQKVSSGTVIEALGHAFDGDRCTKCGEHIFSYDYIYENEEIIAVRINGYRGEGPDLSVPAEIEGYPVTVIGEYAFSNRDDIVSVVLPDTLETIELGAFASCYYLETVNFPDSLISIGQDVFNSCGSLTSAVLPNGLTEIQNNTFAYCDDLENVVLPENLVRIGEYAFYQCEKLKEIDLPDSLAYIEEGAFNSCYDLMGIVLPVSLGYIGDSAFYDCDDLVYVVMGEGVISIGENAFNYCGSLNHLFYAGSEEALRGIAIAGNNEYLLNATIHYGASVDAMEETVVDATCAQTGSTALFCTICESSVISAVTSTLPHVFENGVCETCGNLEADLIESEHPYTDNCDEMQVIYKEGAVHIEITFSASTETENGWDYIYVYDANDEEIGCYTGAELAGQTVIVRGDTVKLRLTSDGSNTRYGYSLVSVVVNYDGCRHLETRFEGGWDPTCYSTGHTGTEYCEDCGEIVSDGEEIPATDHEFSSDYCIYCGTGIYSYRYDYTENGDINGVIITAYNGNEEDVVIPSYYSGYIVRGIDDYAFSGKTFITSVSLPYRINYVGYSAFDGCDSLTTVYYEGTEEKWNTVFVSDGNEPLLSAEFVFGEISVIYGDVDGDGDIYLRDVLFLRKYLAGIISEEDINVEATDVDGNGQLTVADVLLLRKYLAGIITSFPAE